MPRRWSNGGRKIVRPRRSWEPAKRRCVACKQDKRFSEFPTPKTIGFITSVCFACHRIRKGVTAGESLAPPRSQDVPPKPDLRWATWEYRRAD